MINLFKNFIFSAAPVVNEATPNAMPQEIEIAGSVAECYLLKIPKDIMQKILSFLPMQQQLAAIPLVCKQLYQIKDQHKLCQEMLGEVNSFVTRYGWTKDVMWIGHGPTPFATFGIQEGIDCMTMSFPTSMDALTGPYKNKKMTTFTSFSATQTGISDKILELLSECLNKSHGKYCQISITDHIKLISEDNAFFNIINHDYTDFQCHQFSKKPFRLSLASINFIKALKDNGEHTTLKQLSTATSLVDIIMYCAHEIIMSFDGLLKDTQKMTAYIALANQSRNRLPPRAQEQLIKTHFDLLLSADAMTLGQFLKEAVAIAHQNMSEKGKTAAEIHFWSMFSLAAQIFIEVQPLVPALVQVVEGAFNTDNSFCFLRSKTAELNQFYLFGSAIGPGKLELICAEELNPIHRWVAERVQKIANAHVKA